MLHARFEKIALSAPEKTAVIQGQRRVSYGELIQKTTNLAAFLVKAGVRKGDRVGILSENSPEYICAYFGAQKAGAMAVDINHQCSAREVHNIIRHSEPTALIAENRLLDGISGILDESPSIRTVIGIGKSPVKQAPFASAAGSVLGPVKYAAFDEASVFDGASDAFPEMSRQDISTIIYTSGTTGEPKGVMLSHDNICSNADSIISYLHLTERDSVMVILPFCYSYGKSLLTTHLLVGGALVLENSFMYPDVVLRKMIDEGVTGFAGVPSTFAILLNRSAIREYRFPKLRYVTQAGGPMPPQHAQALLGVLPGIDVYIMYGQTEAAPRLTYLEPADLIRKAGSIGKAIPDVTIELIKDGGEAAGVDEDGEIVASGRNIMVGYWHNPEATAKVVRHGKLYTGDIARMDKEGYIYIVGRQSDMIKSGAHRISPKEIEEVILELPEVHEVAVIGMPDPILGESIKAFIVLKSDVKMDSRKVQLHCQAKLAPFKIPKEVVFVTELPKTNAGKVRRHLLKHQTKPADTN